MTDVSEVGLFEAVDAPRGSGVATWASCACPIDVGQREAILQCPESPLVHPPGHTDTPNLADCPLCFVSCVLDVPSVVYLYTMYPALFV